MAEGELRDSPGDPDPGECLSALGSFIRPLSPGERVRQEQLYADREGGYLCADDIRFAMIAIAEGWY
jgi:hypothetical protein